MGPWKIQDRLLEEDASSQSITLPKLIEKATLNASKQWTERGTPTSINHNKQHKKFKSRRPNAKSKGGVSNPGNDKFKCQVCGRTNHATDVCKFKNYTYNTCGVLGHLSPMCKSKTKNKNGKGKGKTQNKFITDDDRGDSCINLVESFFAMGEVSNHNKRGEPFKILLTVDDTPILFEIDTGSLHSVMSENTYKYFSMQKLLKRTISL